MLQEIEAAAEEYRNAQEVRLQQIRERNLARAGELAQESDERSAKETARVENILGEFRVREVLEAIRDSEWHEGKVQPTNKFWDNAGRMATGLELVSDSYSVLERDGFDDGRLSVYLRDENSRLQVTVPPLGPKHTKDFILVEDLDIYNLRPEDSLSLTDRMIRNSRDYGVREAIRMRTVQKPGGIGYIVTDSPDAFGKFSHTVDTLIKLRRDNQSLPAQVRGWTNDLIDQFPASLREIGSVGGRELRAWALEKQRVNPVLAAIRTLI